MSGLHEEVERAAFDAMREQDAGPDVPLVPPAFAQAVEARFAPTRDARDVSTGVESLYDEFPIGDGNHRLRVVRLQPDKWDGVQISGVIDELVEKLDTMQFGMRYGGGQYRVQVLGYEMRPGGRGDLSLRVKKEIVVKIPGKPNPTFFRVRGEGGGDDMGSEVALKMLEMSRDQNARMADVNKPNVDLMRAAQEMAAERAQEVRVTMSSQVQGLQREVDRLGALLQQREDKIRSLGDEVVRIERDRDKRVNDAEMQRVQELRTQQDNMTREMTAKHQDEVRHLRDEAARQQAEARQRQEEALAALRLAFDTERQQTSARQDAERQQWNTKLSDEIRRIESSAGERYTSLKDLYALQLEEARRSATERLADLVRSHESELRSLRDAQALQLEAIRSNEGTKSSAAERTADTKVAYMERQLQELRAEQKQLKAENQQLRDEKYKPVHVAIQEAQQIVALTGGNQQGGGEGEDDKPKTWQDKLVDIALAVAPALAQGAASRLGGPPPDGAGGAGAGHPGAPQLPQGGRIPAGAQQPMPQRRRAARPVAPGQWAPPGPGDARVPMPPDYPVAPAPRASVIPMGAARPTDPGAVVSPAAVEQMMPEPAAAVAQAEQQGPSGPPPTADDQTMAFIQELDRAIGGGSKGPDVFAREFVDGVGAAQAQQVLQALSPDQLVAFVEQMPGGSESAIATLQGRRYLKELWRQAARIVARKSAASAASAGA